MILSYHPCFEADQNLICAGRLPGASDRKAITAAQAVILPQGCSRELYQMARDNCTHVFPNWDAKFDYPGKLGQIRLFRKHEAPHPNTLLFKNLHEFRQLHASNATGAPLELPFVLKLDWGGEGEGVFHIQSQSDIPPALAKIEAFETTGLKGFLIQEFIPCANRSLRVVVIGEKFYSYWRVQKESAHFLTNISKGAIIDSAGDPELQMAGMEAARKLCRGTGINLAGFDLLFDTTQSVPKPVFLEINYFFGRSGLGGSDVYYDLLCTEIRNWINKLASDAD